MSVPAKAGVLLTACLLLTLASGCFQANEGFYGESAIVQDKRLEGRFLFATNEPASLVIKLSENGHYRATVTEGGKWITLDVVLFKCGNNLFFDISRVSDNGLNHEPAVGPSALDLLHLATYYDTHSVIRVRFTEKGFEIGWNYGNPVYSVLEQCPYLKFRVATKREPLDPAQKILTNPTEELFRFLQTAGTNDAVFGFHGGFERLGK